MTYHVQILSCWSGSRCSIGQPLLLTQTSWVLPPLSVGKMTLRLYGALNYSHGLSKGPCFGTGRASPGSRMMIRAAHRPRRGHKKRNVADGSQRMNQGMPRSKSHGSALAARLGPSILALPPPCAKAWKLPERPLSLRTLFWIGSEGESGDRFDGDHMRAALENAARFPQLPQPAPLGQMQRCQARY